MLLLFYYYHHLHFTSENPESREAKTLALELISKALRYKPKMVWIKPLQYCTLPRKSVQAEEDTGDRQDVLPEFLNQPLLPERPVGRPGTVAQLSGSSPGRTRLLMNTKQISNHKTGIKEECLKWWHYPSIPLPS